MSGKGDASLISGCETKEYLALHKCYADISRSIQSPLPMGADLLSVEFISDALHSNLIDYKHDERVYHIMKAVLNKVKEDSNSLYKFIDILEKDLSLRSLARKLRQECGLDEIVLDTREMQPNSDDHSEAFKKAVREKGSLTCFMVQCMPFGPPRVGKSCLYSRLLDKQPPGQPSTRQEVSSDSKSTSTLEERKMIQVKIGLRSNQGSAVAILAEDGEWNEVNTLEDEIAIYLKSIESQGCNMENSKQSSGSSSKVPVATDANDAKLDEVAIKAITQAITKGNVDMDKVQALLDKSLTIFYTDTGGQPEFHEVLPALVAGPTLFLLIFSLFNSIDSLYEVRYEPSSLVKYQVYETSFTVREVLMQCLSSIASYHNAQSRDYLKSKPASQFLNAPPISVLMVGTHRDLVDEEKVEEVNETLKKSIVDTVLYKQSLIEPFSEKSLIIPVNNYKSEDGKNLRYIIERVIKRENEGVFPYKVELPVHWLGLELSLRQMASSTVSYKECSALAQAFNVPNKELPECLWFLHYKTGTIRYYGQVKALREVIIIKPVVVFAAITEFITSTFTLEKVGINVQSDFKTMGLFKTVEVRSIFDRHQDKLALSFDQFLALLQHLNILGRAFDKKFDYFLPCALVHVNAFSEKQLDESTLTICAKLLVGFESEFLPKGIFSGLLAFLCNEGWAIARDPNSKLLLFRNHATFSVESEYCSVTLKALPKYLELGIDFENEEPSPKSFCVIRELMQNGLSNVCKTLQYGNVWSFGLYCTRSKCKHVEKHFARIDPECGRAVCSKTRYAYPVKDQECMSWFRGIKLESVLATPLSILQKKPLLNHVYLVLQGKSSKWDAIGRGFNVPLNTRETLRRDTSVSDDSRLEEVINTWLETHCHTPVTWTEFINVLTTKLGFKDVAEQVYSFLEREDIMKEYLN